MVGLTHRLLYDSYMTDTSDASASHDAAEVAVSEARNHLADLISRVQRSGEPLFITRRGEAVAVLVDPVAYGRLLAEAEDAVDRAELRAAREDDDYVPWDEVKADLGLV
jgi:prevent-host-death family protein